MCCIGGGESVVPYAEVEAEKDPQSGDHHECCPFRPAVAKVSAYENDCGDQRSTPPDFFCDDSGDQCETRDVRCPARGPPGGSFGVRGKLFRGLVCSYRLDYEVENRSLQQCGDRQGGDGDGDKVRDGWGLWEYAADAACSAPGSGKDDTSVLGSDTEDRPHEGQEQHSPEYECDKQYDKRCDVALLSGHDGYACHVNEKCAKAEPRERPLKTDREDGEPVWRCIRVYELTEGCSGLCGHSGGPFRFECMSERVRARVPYLVPPPFRRPPQGNVTCPPCATRTR